MTMLLADNLYADKEDPQMGRVLDSNAERAAWVRLTADGESPRFERGARSVGEDRNLLDPQMGRVLDSNAQRG